ncbi:hypothetical protein D3C81_627560 [compost metagenome]
MNFDVMERGRPLQAVTIGVTNAQPVIPRVAITQRHYGQPAVGNVVLAITLMKRQRRRPLVAQGAESELDLQRPGFLYHAIVIDQAFSPFTPDHDRQAQPIHTADIHHSAGGGDIDLLPFPPGGGIDFFAVVVQFDFDTAHVVGKRRGPLPSDQVIACVLHVFAIDIAAEHVKIADALEGLRVLHQAFFY